VRAREDLGLEARLCPDMAFALPALPAAPRSARGVLWLLRRDRESASPDGRPPAGARVSDWPGEPRSVVRRVQRVLTRSLALLPGGRWWRRRALESTYAPVARRRLSAALALLRSAEVVVTDRLHGHLLCVLAGIPHVVLGDRHGKVAGVREAWTREAPGVLDATSVDDAAARAAGLLAAGADG
jgi:exopolysaccharide biosynthesis predicted pyruvyltransferase EpsI